LSLYCEIRLVSVGVRLVSRVCTCAMCFDRAFNYEINKSYTGSGPAVMRSANSAVLCVVSRVCKCVICFDLAFIHEINKSYTGSGPATMRSANPAVSCTWMIIAFVVCLCTGDCVMCVVYIIASQLKQTYTSKRASAST